MSAASFTPGPWFLHTYGDGSMGIVTDDGAVVCPVRPRTSFDEDIPNFVLMTSTPGLLAALQRCVEALDLAERIAPREPLIEQANDQAKAAINKATGETK